MNKDECYEQMASCNYAIQRCYDEIRAMKNQEQELNDMKRRFDKLNAALVSAAESGARKIDSLFSIFEAAGSALRSGFFNRMSTLYKGQEYRKACRGAESALEEIVRKINQIKNNINKKYTEIEHLESQIASLRWTINRLEESEMEE